MELDLKPLTPFLVTKNNEQNFVVFIDHLNRKVYSLSSIDDETEHYIKEKFVEAFSWTESVYEPEIVDLSYYQNYLEYLKNQQKGKDYVS